MPDGRPTSTPARCAENGEQAIAQELVDPAAVLGNGRADHGEELVQDENHVERQPLLGEAREIAQIDEHDGERLLDAARILLLELGGLRTCGRRLQQPRHDHALLGPDLTGEPHVLRRADRAKRHAFWERRRGQCGGASIDAHAAGGAARTAAADGGVRNLGGATDLQKRWSLRHLDCRPARVGDRHLGPRQARKIGPGDARRDHAQDDCELYAHQRPEPGETRAIGGARPVRQLLEVIEHARHLDRRGDAAARHDEAAQRGERDHDGPRQQHTARRAGRAHTAAARNECRCRRAPTR